MKNVLAKQNTNTAAKPQTDFVVAKVTADSAEQTVGQLKAVNTSIQNLDKSLNSNVIKLSNQIKKQSEAIQKQYRAMSEPEAQGVTDKVMGRREYRTVKPRVEDLKTNIKDFFTIRGFLDKTGIVKRKSGGLISEYLDRAEDRRKYVENRMKVDPTAKLHGDKKAREIFARQFNEQQNVEIEMRKNEKALKELKDSGFTEAQIKRSAEFKKSQELATQMAKADTRVRPEGFDPKTGLIKDAYSASGESEKTGKSADVIPFKKKESDSSLGSEETMLEQNRMMAEQTGLLQKIEENTRGGTPGPGGKGGGGGDGGGSLLDGLLGMGKSGLRMAGGLLKGAGKIATTAGKSVLGAAGKVGMGLLQRAGPLAAVAAAGAGIYAGYSKYQDAKQEESKALNDIDAKVKSGEIDRKQADVLRAQVGEQALVDKSGAVGSGAGQAAGGVAGALKGAALGAAVGSAVPIVGTVIGGAIGATVGAIGGSYLGGKIGEYGGKAVGHMTNTAKGLYAGAKDAGNRLMGWGKDKIKSVKDWGAGKIEQVKDTYNRGNTGTAEGEAMFQTVQNRAMLEGAVGEDGEIIDQKKYEKIRKETFKELRDKGALTSGDVMVQSKEKLSNLERVDKDGKFVAERNFDTSITSEKSVLGSTFLGKLFSAKGTETGSLLGQQEKSIEKDGKSSTEFTQIYGSRKSGGFFGRDTYTIVDPETGKPMDVSRADYNKIQKFLEKEDISSAKAYIEEIKAGTQNDAGKILSPEEVLTPVSEGASNLATVLDKKSAENEAAKRGVEKGSATTVNAPTVNNINNTTKTEVKAPIRNQESMQREYVARRVYA